MSAYPLQMAISALFFFFAIAFSVFSILLHLFRLRPWCSCETCRTYLSAGWRGKFDNLGDWYAHLLRESPTGTIHVHILGNTITANPDNVEHMLRSRFDVYPKGKPFSDLLGDLLGKGIFNVDGGHWRFQRKMASLELGSVTVRSYAFAIVSSEIQSRLLPFLSSAAAGAGGTIDLQDVFRRFSFDGICRISFGFDPGCLDLSRPMSEIAKAFDFATQLSARRAAMASPVAWKVKRFLNLGSEKQLKEAISIVNKLAEEVIRHRRNSPGHDLLSLFMVSVDDDKYLRDIVVSFMLAGRDTVASGLTSLFWVLGQHPKVEAAIRDEVKKVVEVSSTEVSPSLQQLREMHYLHAVIHEVLRLYPPVQFDSRFPTEDDVMADGTFVRKGSRVTYHAYAMGRMESIWGADCMEFRPERWMRGGKFSPASPFKFPAFHAGLRMCLGKEMAIMEMKSVAAAVVPRFSFRAVAPERALVFVGGLTASLVGGLPVSVHGIS